uniref:O-methyltransferase n=1 Tax=Panagrellus redivivus TaxID=6233 RepID=A0A7E4VG76_PANRE
MNVLAVLVGLLCLISLVACDVNDEVGTAPTEDLSRAKRGLLDLVSIGDFNWLHKFLEMVFGDLYTELVDSNPDRNVDSLPFPPTTTKNPFEAALKPWVKNITTARFNTKPQPTPMPHGNLPYPHVFTTPRPRRPIPATDSSILPFTTSPFTTAAVTSQFLERPYTGTASSTTNTLAKAGAAGAPAKMNPPPSFSASPTRPEPQHSAPRNCDTCQTDGSHCSVKIKSFDTTDPVYQYVYSHGTPMTDILDAVLRDTQTLSMPPPWTWKVTATPETVQLTTSLMNLYKPNRSLVIGVFTGLALIGVASVMDSRGIVIGLEYPENSHFWERVGMKHAQRAGIMNRIQVRSVEPVDKALTKLAAYEPNAFDFVFVNELQRGNCLDDYEHSVRLLRTSGLMIITDALEGGEVLSGPDVDPDIKVVQSMNSRIKNDPRVSASLLPYGGGTWVIVKN